MKSKITKEFLKKYYIEKDMSLSQIAKEFNYSKASLSRAINRFDLKKTKKQIQEKRKASFESTCIERYGVSNHFELSEFQSKAANTNMKRYGAKSVLSLEEFRNKAEVTNLKRYGTKYPSQSEEVKDKIKNTTTERYGVDSFLKTEELRESLKKSALQRYGVEYFSQSEDIKDKIKLTCIRKYGVTNPSYINMAKERRIKTKIDNGHILTIGGKMLKEWSDELEIPYDYLIRKVAKDDTIKSLLIYKNDYENNITDIERIISDILNISKFNKVIPGMRKKYRPDFKISDSIYLNCDGLYWHSDFKLDRRYHFDLRKEFEEHKLKIIQFRADEIKDKSDLIRSMVIVMNGRIENRIFARKCSLEIVSNKIASKFLKENHLMGDIKAKHIALKYQNEIVSIMSFKQYRDVLKVERFCSLKNNIVVGGFSKILKSFFKYYNFEKIDYWVDLRYGGGGFLLNHGFKHVKDTLGWKWTDLDKTYNRLRCRANMDERRLSEKEYALEFGWVKIYDAGQRLYRFER